MSAMLEVQVTAVRQLTPVVREFTFAALDGSLKDAEFRTDPNFGFQVPVEVPGVDTAILDPRSTWDDKDAYDRKARELVERFIENFAQFADHVDEGVREAAPKAA